MILMILIRAEINRQQAIFNPFNGRVSRRFPFFSSKNAYYTLKCLLNFIITTSISLENTLLFRSSVTRNSNLLQLQVCEDCLQKTSLWISNLLLSVLLSIRPILILLKRRWSSMQKSILQLLLISIRFIALANIEFSQARWRFVFTRCRLLPGPLQRRRIVCQRRLYECQWLSFQPPTRLPLRPPLRHLAQPAGISSARKTRSRCDVCRDA